MLRLSRSRITTGFRATLLLGAGVAALVRPALADIASPAVTELGSFGGGQSETGTDDVTDSGVVVGDATLTGDNNTYTLFHAFRWTASGGLQDLGTLGGTWSSASGVSADGSVVVGGAGRSGDSPWYGRAFRWTRAGGMVDLGTFGGTYSWANGVSADGSVVVGYANLTGDIDQHAFRWTQAGGMADLGTLGGSYSQANGVSADGSVVVGFGYLTGDTEYRAFRWTQAGGMVDLGTLGGSDAEAFGVSADGSTTVGFAKLTGDSANHAFRWTHAGGMADLGTLGGTNSYANGVSADGSVVVGEANITGDSDTHAFRWTQAGGTKDLNTLLSNAGVNMTGIDLNYAYGISPNGKYIVGSGAFPDSPYEAFLVCYDPGSGCVGLTTASSQQAATQALSANQRASLIESRSAAGELLGMTRPVDTGSYSYAGTMFGSALGYTGGQYAAHGVTIMGGIAYGSEDYPNITQDNAPTVAAAVRYTFDDPFGDGGKTLHPYAELGGWVTPQASLTLTRSYANGSGTSTGQGGTNATSWAEYGRGGMIWDITAADRLTGYGELGQQYMSFGAYSEDSTNNPFPASVGAGLLRLGVARLGGLWTHKIDGLYVLDGGTRPLPISITLAGDVAQSFDVHSGLTATVSGVGSSSANNGTDTWGEFGGRVTAGLMQNVDLNLDVNGTTGGGALGTALHGGVGVTYSF